MATSVLAAISISPSILQADEPAPGKQVEQSLKVKEGLTVPFLLALPALPKDYGKETGKKCPVILFLHRRGESNGPLSIVAKWGPPCFAARCDDFPYIVISPQCPNETNWNDDEQQEGVFAVLEDTIKKFDCDPARVSTSVGHQCAWRQVIPNLNLTRRAFSRFGMTAGSPDCDLTSDQSQNQD